MNQVNFNPQNLVKFKSAQDMHMQQIPQMQLEQTLPDVQIPDMYYVPTERYKKEDTVETIKKYDMFGMIHPWLTHPLLMLGSFTGLCWGIDKFAKSCGGEYEKSIVGKAATFGDNLQNSKFVQSKPFQSVLGLGRSAKNKFYHIFRNSDVVNAIRTTPSQPEWNFVKDELLNMNQRVVHDFSRITNTLKLNQEGFAELCELGLDKKDKKFIKEFFKGAKITEVEASNAIQLKRIGMADDAIREILSKPDAVDIVKAKQLEKLGINAEFLEKIQKNQPTLRDVAKVRKACQNAGGIRVGAGHQKWLGPIQPFERRTSLDEIANRITSMTKAKTKTGKALATFLQKFHRGFTFGGGKIGALLFVSPMLVETILDTKKAEPNQKVGTIVHGIVESAAWVFTFPLALSIMHHLGGAQYAGMKPEAIEESRKLLKEFNEKTNPYVGKPSFLDKLLGRGQRKPIEETFQSYSEYKAAKDKLKEQLKALRKTEGQTLFTKISKKMGRFLTMDLEIIKAYNGPGSFNIRNIGKKVSNTCRNIGGVPMRVGIWLGISTGVLGAGLTKGINTVFGKHYDRFKEEEFTEAKKEQKKFLKEDLQARLLDAQREKIMESMNPQEKTNSNQIQNNKDYKHVVPDSIKDFATKSANQEIQLTKNENNDDHNAIKNKNNESNSLQNNKEEPTPPAPALITNTKETSEQETQKDNNPQKEVQLKDSVHSLSTEESPEVEEQEINEPLQENLVQKQPLEETIPVNAETLEKNPENSVSQIQTQANNPINENISDNNLQNEAEIIKDNYDYIPTPTPINNITKKTQKRDNYTYIPSSENLIKNDKNETEVNKYIPSQKGAKFTKTFDNSGLEAALKRADRAERRAIQVLAGNYNTY